MDYHRNNIHLVVARRFWREIVQGTPKNWQLDSCLDRYRCHSCHFEAAQYSLTFHLISTSTIRPNKVKEFDRGFVRQVFPCSPTPVVKTGQV